MSAFGDAFKAARSAGKSTFTYNGKSYTTQTKEEAQKASSAPASSRRPRARPSEGASPSGPTSRRRRSNRSRSEASTTAAAPSRGSRGRTQRTSPSNASAPASRGSRGRRTTTRAAETTTRAAETGAPSTSMRPRARGEEARYGSGTRRSRRNRPSIRG